MTTNKDLQRWFDKANFNYFGNKLPRVPVKFGAAKVKGDQAIAYTMSVFKNKQAKKRKSSKIVIYKDLNKPWFETTAAACLLHEMIHLKLHAAKSGLVRHDCKSGKGPFAKELKRLMKRGAFDYLL